MDTVWHGSPHEYLRLVQAVRANCTCRPAEPDCSACALYRDQRALDGLAYARTLRTVYFTEEGLR